VDERDLRVVLALLIEALDDPRRDDAASAQDDRAALRAELVVDAVMVLIGVYDTFAIRVLLAIRGQVRQQLDGRIADGHVHVCGGNGEVAALRSGARRRDDDDVAFRRFPDRPDASEAQHLGPADAPRLAFDGGEDVARAGRVCLDEGGLAQDLPPLARCLPEVANVQVVHDLARRVARKPHTLSGRESGVGSQPFVRWDLRIQAQPLIAREGHRLCADDRDLFPWARH